MNAHVMEKWNPIKSAIADDAGITSPMRIVIAGGVTGGHFFPGIAIADEFANRNPANKVLFVSIGTPLETAALSNTNYRLETIKVEGIKGRGIFRKAISILKIPKGICESIRILKRFRADLVIGVGSYSAGPVVVAAWLMGIKIAIHEQNVLPGITNRLLSRFAEKIFVSFDNMNSYFSPRKVTVTGNPVRKEILRLVKTHPTNSVEREGKEYFRILVIGGSQGAHSINLAVIESLQYLENTSTYQFIHQAGPQDIQQVKSAYRQYGISSMVEPFFKDMNRQYQKADLIVCRAGATTLAEIAAIGKGVIFVPFPFAADNHQEMNARTLSEKGAAEMILERDLNGRILADRITFYAANPEMLALMASNAKDLGRPDAARRIVKDCYGLFGLKQNVS